MASETILLVQFAEKGTVLQQSDNVLISKSLEQKSQLRFAE